jgi:serralysin
MQRTALTETDFTTRYDLALNGNLATASTFNLTFPDPGSTAGLPDLATPGETIRGKPVYGFTGDWDAARTGNNNVRTQLDSGQKQDTSDGVITFGFLNQQHVTGINNSPKLGEGGGYTPFSPAQQAAARIAVQNWDDLISAKFVEVTPGPGASTWAQSKVDIWLANTYTGPGQGGGGWQPVPAGVGRCVDRRSALQHLQRAAQSGFLRTPHT